MSWRLKNGYSTAGAQPNLEISKKIVLFFFINEIKNIFKFIPFASCLCHNFARKFIC